MESAASYRVSRSILDHTRLAPKLLEARRGFDEMIKKNMVFSNYTACVSCSDLIVLLAPPFVCVPHRYNIVNYDVESSFVVQAPE